MAGLLSAADPDSGLALCVLSQTEDGLSVILAGNIDLAASSSRGEVKLSGRDAATWVDRILEGTLGSCSVSAGGAEPPKRTAMYELQGGVVPGVGITLVGGGHVVATPGRGGRSGGPATRPLRVPLLRPERQLVSPPVCRVVRAALTDLAEPLPAADPSPSLLPSRPPQSSRRPRPRPCPSLLPHRRSRSPRPRLPPLPRRLRCPRPAVARPVASRSA